MEIILSDQNTMNNMDFQRHGRSVMHIKKIKLPTHLKSCFIKNVSKNRCIIKRRKSPRFICTLKISLQLLFFIRIQIAAYRLWTKSRTERSSVYFSS